METKITNEMLDAGAEYLVDHGYFDEGMPQFSQRWAVKGLLIEVFRAQSKGHKTESAHDSGFPMSARLARSSSLPATVKHSSSEAMRVEKIGDATLYSGDCREVLPKLEPVDVVVTDPPYNFNAYASDVNFCADTLTAFDRKAIFGYPEILAEWCACWGRPTEWVVWYPTNKPSGRSKYLSRSSEHIAIYGDVFWVPQRPRSADATSRKIAAIRNNSVDWCKDDDVWRDPSPGVGFNRHLRRHPNEKPKSIMTRIVKMCSKNQETICDPFMGSGTTGVACANLGRKFIGIEIDPNYFEIACERIEAAQKQGRLFDDATSLQSTTDSQANGGARELPL